jgi:hypothetical protein
MNSNAPNNGQNIGMTNYPQNQQQNQQYQNQQYQNPNTYGQPNQNYGGPQNQMMYNNRGQGNVVRGQGVMNSMGTYINFSPILIDGVMTDFNYNIHPKKLLDICTGAIIKQIPNLFELLTGCITNNRFNIFLKFADGTIRKVFKAREYSGWCMKNCCTATNRGFHMKVKYQFDEMDDDFSKNVISELERPFKCVCCCCNRPEMFINWTLGGSNQFSGRVHEPFTCCDPRFEVFDSSNNMKYFLEANCCQCGIFCRGTICGKMSDVVFPIYNGNSDIVDPQNQVGTITKKYSGFANSWLDIDTFNIEFPLNSTPDDKFNLIMTAVMIDYLLYESVRDEDTNRMNNY